MSNHEQSPEARLEEARRRQAQRREQAAREKEQLSKLLRSPVFLAGVAIGGIGLIGITGALVTGEFEPFNEDVCRTESGRLSHVQQCLGVLSRGGSWTHAELSAEKCKRYIGSVMGRSTAGMNVVSEGKDLVRIDYIRTDDSKRFTYECSTLGDKIIWRGIDIFGPGEGPGRWRKEDAVPIESV